MTDRNSQGNLVSVHETVNAPGATKAHVEETAQFRAIAKAINLQSQ
jgi:hypothetical protein